MYDDLYALGGKAHIFKSDLSGEWFLRLLADNGEPIMASEGHKNRSDVVELATKYFPHFEIVDKNDTTE